MLKSREFLIGVVCMLAVAAPAQAIAPDFIEKLAADSRPEADKVRDSARRPYQVMMALGVQQGMTAIDVGAGGGWYTRVLSAAVGSDGTVIAQGVRQGGEALMELGNVELAAAMSDIDASSADVAVTALNIHHLTDERAGDYFQGIYRVLKPGGTAAIIDHVGVAGTDYAGLHRMLPADARRWIEDAGFEIVEESDILRTAADDHTLNIRDPILGRNVDRFLFVVRKPN